MALYFLSIFRFLPHKIRFQLLQHLSLLTQIPDHLTLFYQHDAVAEVYKFC